VLFLKTFPKPLSVEEENYYMKKSREGDMAAREILILRNMRLVAHVVKKYQCPENEQEELISIGTIGLIKAIATVDTEKGRLSTYAARCIENELLMYFRSRKKQTKEVSYYEPIGTDKEGNEISLLDVIESQEPDAFELLSAKDDTKKVYEMLPSVLTKREREVLTLRYGLYGGKEYTQREVAEYMGISRSYISRIEKTAIEKLRSCF
jgi:RNA polymerase sporulation-specific sigma factor